MAQVRRAWGKVIERVGLLILAALALVISWVLGAAVRMGAGAVGVIDARPMNSYSAGYHPSRRRGPDGMTMGSIAARTVSLIAR